MPLGWKFIPDAPHIWTLESPEAINRLVLGFLVRSEGRNQARNVPRAHDDLDDGDGTARHNLTLVEKLTEVSAKREPTDTVTSG